MKSFQDRAADLNAILHRARLGQVNDAELVNYALHYPWAEIYATPDGYAMDGCCDEGCPQAGCVTPWHQSLTTPRILALVERQLRHDKRLKQDSA
ncbi:MAG: hypothetical protein HKM02_11055 [Pseudomonadales bacterium]|nr:hypothetical protein [Pseudomonadales bacterium]